MIDIVFEVGMRAHSLQIEQASREAVAEWIADQLRQCGFNTRPQGMSWGVLEEGSAPVPPMGDAP